MMIYFMHKETFDITRRLDGVENSNDYFDVDYMLILPIQVLNRKGYITMNCCSGHPFPNFFVEVNPNKPQYRFNNCYISFKEGISLPSLPYGFTIPNWGISNHLTICRYWDNVKSYDTMCDFLGIMEELYDWALTLPNFTELGID